MLRWLSIIQTTAQRVSFALGVHPLPRSLDNELPNGHHFQSALTIRHLHSDAAEIVHLNGIRKIALLNFEI